MPTIEQGRPQASRGFTLIEMSIVLVIIGLIVGGILKGQEIVNQAREKQVINQLQSVRTGVNTYIDRHAMYPGDDVRSKTLNSGLTAGNGDRFIGANAGTAAGAVTAMTTNSKDPTKEEGSFFVSLLAEGLIGNAIVPVTLATMTDCGVDHQSFLPNTAFPNTCLGVASSQHAGDTARDPASPIPLGTNWLGIQSLTISGKYGVNPRQASHIDTALDDGLPDTGIVRGDDDKCNTAGAVGYLAAADVNTPTCNILINLGPNGSL